MIPLSRGSFDVIVGIDWLSKSKFVIVCYEKVVRIPLEGDEILQVHGERTLGAAKALMNAKVDKPRISDIPVARDITDVFLEDLLELPPHRQVEFRIDLVPGATLVAKSPYRLAPSEMRELSGQLQELQDKGLSSYFIDDHSGLLKVEEDMKLFEVTSVGVTYGRRSSNVEAYQAENVLAERLPWFRSTDGKKRRQEFVLYGSNLGSIGRKCNGCAHAQDNSKEWNSGDDQLKLRWMIYLVVLADAAESVRNAIGFEFGGSYHLSIRCAPFKALYGRKCRSLILWAEIEESSLTGLELAQETTDKVVLVKEKPKAARDRQKSYVDYRRKPLEFEVGDRVLLKVTPWKGVVRFGKKGKLAPRYVGPFEIRERIGLVAYRLRLPKELNSVHDTFHVSNLKKCLADANLHVPLDEIKVDKTLRFIEEPVEIIDREIKKLKRRKIALVKVRWNSKRGPEFTWEHEDQMRIKYP
ncbi:hypothetical protein Tco_1291577 [Tanacetum coccineum]